MEKSRIEYYANVKNRYNLTSFIDDAEKIDEIYEGVLAIVDDSFIDMMDHFMIATCNELGMRKELEIIELKKEIQSLKGTL